MAVPTMLMLLCTMKHPLGRVICWFDGRALLRQAQIHPVTWVYNGRWLSKVWKLYGCGYHADATRHSLATLLAEWSVGSLAGQCWDRHRYILLLECMMAVDLARHENCMPVPTMLMLPSTMKHSVGSDLLVWWQSVAETVTDTPAAWE